ncbi:HAD family hydrolase [Pendulispora albinea]|uniref:HAD-IA family hydrolase n=1 Tax=Pendulispora albinea TaxID=2741071 RepID=A0ABZ2LU53_9BACT
MTAKAPKLTLLFDLDGTLVDTDPLHFRAFGMLMEENGRPPLELSFYKTRIMGYGFVEIMALLFPERSAREQHVLADRKEKLFRDLVGTLEPTPGIYELLDWARERGARCGVVTNAPRENAALLLASLDLERRFDTVVIGEELPHAKPHPLPYLTGLERLDGVAGAALAFEDSLSGVRAAAAAGIDTVGVRSSLPEQALRDAGARHVIDDFRDRGLWSELYRHAGESSLKAGE